MAFIVQTIVGDQRIQLGGEELIRKMQWGNNWNSLRIAIRWSMNPYYQTIAGGQFTCTLAVGLLNGSDPSTGFGQPNTGDWIGEVRGAASYTTFTNNTTYYAIARPYPARKVGAALTVYSPGTTYGNYCNIVGVQAGPSPYLLNIVRSGTTYTIVGAAAADQTVISRYTHLLNAEGGTSGLSSFYTPAAVTAGNNFDTFSLYWMNTCPTAEFSDITIARLY